MSEGAATPGGVSLDNPPALVAQAIKDEKVVDATIPPTAVTDANLASAIDDMDIHDDAGPADVQVEEVAYDEPDAYDVDLDKLQAALDNEDNSDEYYSYYF